MSNIAQMLSSVKSNAQKGDPKAAVQGLRALQSDGWKSHKEQNGGTGGDFDAVAARHRTSAFLQQEAFLQRYHSQPLLPLSHPEALQSAKAWHERRRGKGSGGVGSSTGGGPSATTSNATKPKGKGKAS